MILTWSCFRTHLFESHDGSSNQCLQHFYCLPKALYFILLTSSYLISSHQTLHTKTQKGTFRQQIKDSLSPLNWPIDTKSFLPKTFFILTQKTHISNKEKLLQPTKKDILRKKFLYFFTKITNFLSEKNSYTCR